MSEPDVLSIEAARSIAADYPLLYEHAVAYDIAERLGGCTDPLATEIDAALRELWLARQSAPTE